MTKDQIIAWAQEAGFVIIYSIHEGCAERFANLVAAAEREACAKVCDEQKDRCLAVRDKSKRVTDQRVYHFGANIAEWNAAEIRARGQK